AAETVPARSWARKEFRLHGNTTFGCSNSPDDTFIIVSGATSYLFNWLLPLLVWHWPDALPNLPSRVRVGATACSSGGSGLDMR
ncbi:MAG: hypothetical protein ACKPKO_60470, partial [Candidatus Fonsibacter sp.]